MPDLDLATRLRTIRDGLHAGCTVDELTADIEVALSLAELDESASKRKFQRELWRGWVTAMSGASSLDNVLAGSSIAREESAED